MFDTDLEVLDEHGARLAHEEFPAVKTLETGESIANLVIGARARGQDRITWVLCGAQQLRDPDTKLATGVICTIVDITEQRASQDAIRASEERFRLFAENAADVIYRVGLSPLRFEYINPAIYTILGYTRDDFYRNPRFVFELIHPDDVEATRATSPISTMASNPLVIRMTRRDGGVIFTEHRIVQVMELGTLVALEGIVRDVTALKTAEADLNRLALHDSLTGLPNRAQLLDRLDRALARDRRDPNGARGALHRRRPVQGGERQSRSWRRRPAPRRGRAPDRRDAATQRLRRPPRRRRVRRRAARAPRRARKRCGSRARPRRGGASPSTSGRVRSSRP